MHRSGEYKRFFFLRKEVGIENKLKVILQFLCLFFIHISAPPLGLCPRSAALLHDIEYHLCADDSQIYISNSILRYRLSSCLYIY